MRLYDLAMLLAVFFSPIFAVVITLFIEDRRKSKESKLYIVKMLMSTRHLVGDPMYSAAINLVPIEFHSDKSVVAAYNAYIAVVKFPPTEDNKEIYYKELIAKQTNLIFKILKSTGFNIQETDLLTYAYASDALVQRDNLYLESLLATKEIASTLREQTEILKNNH